jgi:hypothetical protein
MTDDQTRDGNGSDMNRRLVELARRRADVDWPSLLLIASLQTQGRTPIQRQEDIIRLARALRNVGAIEVAEAHFMISPAIKIIVEQRQQSSPALTRIYGQIEEARKALGLADDEFFRRGEEPPELEALSNEFQRIIDGITAATFDEYGETEIASRFRGDREVFNELYEAGRKAFFGPFPERDENV